MIIDAPIENKVVIGDDPHKAKFFMNKSMDRVSPDLELPTPTLKSTTLKVLTRGEISGYVIFYTRNL